MDRVNQVWHNGFISLGMKYADGYLKGVFELDHMAKVKSHLSNLKEVYNSLVATKKIERIENLRPDEKSELWELCKPYTKELNKEDVIRFCKCYWALIYLTKIISQ